MRARDAALVNHAALANAATFALTLLLLTVVLARRSSRMVDGLLCLLLSGILVWSGGAVWRAMPVSHEQMLAAHHVVFFGVSVVPVTWFLLSLAVTRVAWFEKRPAHTLWLALPGLLFYLAFATNPGHGQFAHIDFEVFERGPLFWAMIAWGFVCSTAGTVVFVRHARWLASRERRGALLLLSAGLIPQFFAATYLFEWIDWPLDPTPASLGVSAAILYPVILGMRAFEDLPLLRRDVIEHLPDPVLIADPEGRLVDLNPAARRLLPEARALRHQPLQEVIARISPHHGAPAGEEILASGEVMLPDVPSEDGRHFRLRGARVESQYGTAAGFFVVLHDRSDELRAERALRQAQRLDSVGMLAAGIAHELNNPLAFVNANLTHLSDAVAAAKSHAPSHGHEAELLDEAPSVLAETRQGVDRIAEIVSGMQRLSRRTDGIREPLDVGPVVEEAVRMAALSTGSGRVEIDLPEDLPMVTGSRGELVQVLLNLIVNARQALADREDGRVRVRVRSADGAVDIEVEDDGPGIPQATIDRIFDPFFTTKAPDQGTGLGLPIAYDLVRDHGGRLTADRSPLGGARFTVCLPARAA